MQELQEIIEFLKDKSEVILEESLAAELGEDGQILSEMKPDILITIGGDGTVLWANRRMSEFSDAVKKGVSQRCVASYAYFEQFFSILRAQRQPANPVGSLNDLRL